MTTVDARPVVLLPRVLPPWRLTARGARHMLERSALTYRRSWVVIVSGFFEPLFYLLSIGVGIGHLVGTVTLPGGEVVDYTQFVAPALLASSAMNGAVYDSTMNVYFKLKFAKIYDAVLATPVTVPGVALGEITWAVVRGTLYASVFLIVMALMGLIASPWAILALPGAMLLGFAFASVGVAGTSYMRSWTDFELVSLIVLPLFLFSATFYPLSTYDRPMQIVVQCTPLYQGVHLLRGLCLGQLDAAMLVNVAYLLTMAVIGLAVANRRLHRLLQP
jgi:lipooligosaccharide transport system permease protein